MLYFSSSSALRQWISGLTISLFVAYIGYILVDRRFTKWTSEEYEEILDGLDTIQENIPQTVQTPQRKNGSTSPDIGEQWLADLRRNITSLSPPDALSEEEKDRFIARKDEAISKLDAVEDTLAANEKNIEEKIEGFISEFGNLREIVGGTSVY